MGISHSFRRLGRVATMLATLDFQRLAYLMWLRYQRLEFGAVNYVSPEVGTWHAPSGGPALAKVIRAVQVPKEAVALDLGVGMGLAAITLSQYFSLVLGVDLSPELIAAAKRNITKLNISNIQLHCADARQFSSELDQVTLVYMYNPFPASVMSVVCENLRQSLQRSPRRLTVIYKNPVCHDVVVAAGFIHQRDYHIASNQPFAVYEANNRER